MSNGGVVMEIETDCYEIELRGHVVGYRTCIICGETFAKDMQHPKRRKCPECSSNTSAKHGKNTSRTEASFREMKRCSIVESKKRLERIRKRDDAWSRWERENGVKSRFEYHGDNLVEIRGRVS